MKRITLTTADPKQLTALLSRSLGDNATIMPAVQKIFRSVKTEQDDAILKKYRARYGDSYRSIRVSKQEIQNAYTKVDPALLPALRQMMNNIMAVQSAQLPRRLDTRVEPEPGIFVWRAWRAIEKIGLYIPGGKAIYPSSVLMSALPAKIAGCRSIVMCSPPREDGSIPPATLVAADMAGISDIFKVGGAEAIAAMTYGTETIPSVYKIFGAGNAMVTAAKMFAQNTIAIDMPAGPSEIMILADDTANPRFIAADLLADGEHGPDSACVLVTTSQRVADETQRELEKQLPRLSTKERATASLDTYGIIARAADMNQAIAFVNAYAPEHLEIMTKRPRAVAAKITDAGSVFLGPWTSKATGDYATGANHVLPTGGMARMYPPLGVDAFGKWMQIQQCSRIGLQRIKKTIEVVAETEQLPAHKNSVTIRF